MARIIAIHSKTQTEACAPICLCQNSKRLRLQDVPPYQPASIASISPSRPDSAACFRSSTTCQHSQASEYTAATRILIRKAASLLVITKS